MSLCCVENIVVVDGVSSGMLYAFGSAHCIQHSNECWQCTISVWLAVYVIMESQKELEVFDDEETNLALKTAALAINKFIVLCVCACVYILISIAGLETHVVDAAIPICTRLRHPFHFSTSLDPFLI